ncbi:MAG: hypothetical protein VYE15_04245 [Myxococcota bacterium]|nr:hypothetical protein [Myxococcota bacterium]
MNVGVMTSAAVLTLATLLTVAPARAQDAPATSDLPVLPFGMDWKEVTKKLPEELRPGLLGVAPMEKPAPALPARDDSAVARNTWEASLAAREQAISRAQQALLREMDRLHDLQKRVEARWVDANEVRRFAEQSCGGSVITAGPLTAVAPPSPEEIEQNREHVVTILKKMKPSQAAQLLLQWDDEMAIEVLKKLSARTASPILAAMPVDASGRITRRMVTGTMAVRVGGEP